MSGPIVNEMENLIEIINGEHEDFEVIQEDESGGKHDSTYHDVLVKQKSTGKYYGIDYETSYNEGIDPGDVLEFPMTLQEVEVTPVISFTWKPLRDPN